MDESEQAALKQRFDEAIEAFIDKVKTDVNVIAVIVGGSVAYDVVWEKSDVDLLVIVRDQVLNSEYLEILQDGITFSVSVITRSSFKRGVEGTVGGSFFQSYLANGRMVYSVDDSLYPYFEDFRLIGEDDRAESALLHAALLIMVLYKGRKALTVRHDVRYAQYYFLKAAESIADMELCLRGIPTGRNAIQKVRPLEPELMRFFYERPLEGRLTEAEMAEALEQLNRYIEGKMEVFQRPVLQVLSDQETRTVSMIAQRLRVEAMYIGDVLDYLAERGVIEKVTQTVKLTPKSRLGVEEIGYLVLGE